MLDNREIAQVRQVCLGEFAEVETAMHADHGSYTYLCALGGAVFFAHSPVGKVLHHFAPRLKEGEPLDAD
jgi:hypothetical protein